jgi:hypothetical protein
VAAMICLMHLAVVAKAISLEDARRKHLMMLDPRMPAKLQQLPRLQLELQQQQRLQQQVQHYATKQPSRSTAKQRHTRSKHVVTLERSAKLLARSLLGRSAEDAANELEPHSKGSAYVSPHLPPASCYHMEQQVVQLLLEFNCSHPVVQSRSQEDLEQQVSHGPRYKALCHTQCEGHCLESARSISPMSQCCHGCPTRVAVCDYKPKAPAGVVCCGCTMCNPDERILVQKYLARGIPLTRSLRGRCDADQLKATGW